MSKIIKSVDAFAHIRLKRFDIADLEEHGRAIVKDAKTKANKMYRDADKILENARSLADTVSAERMKADREISDTETRLSLAEEEARQKGFDEGLIKGEEEGYTEGFEKGREDAHREAYDKAFAEKQAIVEEETRGLTEKIADLLETFDSDIERIRSSARGEVIQLAVAIASKVIKREANLDPAIILPNVQKAIDLSMQKHAVRCRINSEDAALVERFIPRLKSIFARVEHFEIIPDDTIPSGGCIIESGSGSVDMKLETQLAEIERQLLQRKGK